MESGRGMDSGGGRVTDGGGGSRMLSEAGELLFRALSVFRKGMCADCAATLMTCTREISLKATRELILNGSALAEYGACRFCSSDQLITRLRDSRPTRSGG